jgi:hypothetical protein
MKILSINKMLVFSDQFYASPCTNLENKLKFIISHNKTTRSNQNQPSKSIPKNLKKQESKLFCFKKKQAETAPFSKKCREKYTKRETNKL